MLLAIIISELGVPEGLINFFIRGSQGLLFLFNPIKFTSEMFSGMPRVFQEDVLLLGVFTLDFSRLIRCIQPLALVNFGVSFGSLRSSSFSTSIYTEITVTLLFHLM